MLTYTKDDNHVAGIVEEEEFEYMEWKTVIDEDGQKPVMILEHCVLLNRYIKNIYKMQNNNNLYFVLFWYAYVSEAWLM